MPARPLTAPEREEIRVGIERGETDGEIALRLDHHRTTINAEIGRNGGRAAYAAIGAQGRADAQRRRPKTPKLIADSQLAAHVTARLEAKDSPMTIAVELARGVQRDDGARPPVTTGALALPPSWSELREPALLGPARIDPQRTTRVPASTLG